jgi:hypothetical protein
MSDNTLSQVKLLLGKLTDEELQQVVLLATALRTKASKDTELVGWYNAISRVLHEKVEWNVPPLKVLPEATQTQLRKSYYYLLDWLNQVFTPQLTKVETEWALHWCANLLAEELIERDRPLCLNTMLNATQEIPGIVDKAFPGYIKNHTLRWVIKASVMRAVENE